MELSFALTLQEAPLLPWGRTSCANEAGTCHWQHPGMQLHVGTAFGRMGLFCRSQTERGAAGFCASPPQLCRHCCPTAELSCIHRCCGVHQHWVAKLPLVVQEMLLHGHPLP